VPARANASLARRLIRRRRGGWRRRSIRRDTGFRLATWTTHRAAQEIRLIGAEAKPLTAAGLALGAGRKARIGSRRRLWSRHGRDGLARHLAGHLALDLRHWRSGLTRLTRLTVLAWLTVLARLAVLTWLAVLTRFAVLPVGAHLARLTGLLG